MTTSQMDTVMQSLYDYKKFAVLYVDDEEKSLKYFARAFEDQFRIFTAPSAQEGWRGAGGSSSTRALSLP